MIICMVLIDEIQKFFLDKEYTPCPLTERLVKAGYQQVSGGYIDRLRKEGLPVDYRRNTPSQYWHLMSYCKEQDPYKTFPKSVVCGELLFWMAEVSDCVPKTELELLLNEITSNPLYIRGDRTFYDRKKWNSAIHKLCFNAICSIVESKQEKIEIKDRKTIDDYLKMMNRSSVYELTDDELHKWFDTRFEMGPYWVRPNYEQIRPLIDGHSDIDIEPNIDCYPGEAEAFGIPVEGDYYLLRVDGIDYKIDVVDIDAIEVPLQVIEAASEEIALGGQVVYECDYEGEQVFACSYEKEMTIGLPIFYLWNGERVRIVNGEEGEDLLEELPI